MSEYTAVDGLYLDLRSKSITGRKIMSHPSKDGVDKLMSHILKAVNLRSESVSTLGAAERLTMRDASDDALREAEYMVYELIDAATQLVSG